MAFSDAFLQELAERNDIVDVVSGYVRLSKKSGANLFGLCPFHSEKTPSFSVSPEKQIYHCFGCGKGGSVIGFIMEIENLPFADAVAFLARRAGMELPEEGHDEAAAHRRRLLELCRDAARYFRDRLTAPEGRPARDYMERRGIADAVSRRFGLGFAPDSWSGLMDAMKAKGYSERELFDAGLMRKGKNGGGYDVFRNRLMFPVIDVRGAVIGFSGRILGDGEPKYLNSPETPVFSKSRNLFAMNLAKKSKCGYIILSEGNIDVVSLHQAGFDSAVASLGTSLTPEQARLLARFTGEVVIAYDSDEAGRKAAQRAIGILEKLDLKVRVLSLPEAKDPDEYIRRFGAEAFHRVLEGSQTHVEYRLRAISDRNDLLSDEGKVAFLKDALQLLAALPGAVEREVYALRVAEAAGVSKEAVLSETKRLRKKFIEKARTREEAERPAGTAQPASRTLRYGNLRAARAEEGLVRLLYLDPDLLHGRDLPPPEKFTSELLGRFYGELLRRVQGGAALSLSLLAGAFTPKEVGHLTEILQKPEALGNAEKALGDYIEIIEGAGTGSSQEELLDLARKKYRQAKGNGG